MDPRRFATVLAAALPAACSGPADTAAPGTPAAADTAEDSADTGDTGNATADIATCALPAEDHVDPAAPSQYAFELAVVTTNGEALDDGGGSGLASLSATGILGWDVAPSTTMTTTATADGLTGFYGRTADGETPGGCPYIIVERWDLAATSDPGGGFTGTLLVEYSEDVCETRCRAEVEYSVAATPI